MIVKEALSFATDKLIKSGIASPILDAKILLAQALNRDKLFIISNPDYSFDTKLWEEYLNYVKRRCSYEPVAKIIGIKEFWGIEYFTSKDTLDPRSDSETIIDSVLSLYQEKNLPLKILDLGTGTSCLLLSLLSEYKNSCGLGVDISNAALKIAEANAQNLNLSDRVIFIQSDWCKALSKNEKFDIIISNPPYISPSSAKELKPELNFEPIQALFSKDEFGLECYTVIAKESDKFLKNQGRLFLEIGKGMSEPVTRVMLEYNWHLIDWVKDLSGTLRCGIFYYNK